MSHVDPTKFMEPADHLERARDLVAETEQGLGAEQDGFIDQNKIALAMVHVTLAEEIDRQRLRKVRDRLARRAGF